MEQKVGRYLKLSQVCFFGFLAVCTALLPRYLFERNEGGISNFGIHLITVVPFSLAFAGCSACLWQASLLLPGKAAITKQFRLVLKGFSVLLLLVLLSTYPYKVNQGFNDVHIWIGVILFYAELAAAIWLALWVAKNRLNTFLLFIGVVGFILATLTFFGLLHLLFVSQMVTSGTFGALLIRAGSTIATPNPT